MHKYDRGMQKSCLRKPRFKVWNIRCDTVDESFTKVIGVPVPDTVAVSALKTYLTREIWSFIPLHICCCESYVLYSGEVKSKFKRFEVV